MSHVKWISLSKQKEELEEMIEQHGKVLRANKIGMNEPLVDVDGFPLANVDVLSVRKARHAIICLQNDRAKVMKELENEMHQLFEVGRNTVSSDVQQNQDEPMEVDTSSDDGTRSLEPFAVVEKVEPGQLAEQMGVQVRDKILQFGTLTYQNFKSVNQIQAILSNSKGSKIRFVVRKANTGKNVTMELEIGASGTRLGIFAMPLKT